MCVVREDLLSQKRGKEATEGFSQLEHVFILLLVDFGNTTVESVDMAWWSVTNVDTHNSRETPAKLTETSLNLTHLPTWLANTDTQAAWLDSNWCSLIGVLQVKFPPSEGWVKRSQKKNFSTWVLILKAAAFSHSSPESTTRIDEAQACLHHKPWLNPTKLAEVASLVGHVSTWS